LEIKCSDLRYYLYLYWLLSKQDATMVVPATELVVKEAFATVMITGVLVCHICQEIAQRESALMILRGLILLIIPDHITSMLNAPTVVFATAIPEIAIAFLDMKAKDARELPALMIALVMVAAHIFRTCHMLPFLKATTTETTWKTPRPSTTTNGMAPRQEDAFVMLSMAMLIAPRECASMVLM